MVFKAFFRYTVFCGGSFCLAMADRIHNVYKRNDIRIIILLIYTTQRSKQNKRKNDVKMRESPLGLCFLDTDVFGAMFIITLFRDGSQRWV